MTWLRYGALYETDGAATATANLTGAAATAAAGTLATNKSINSVNLAGVGVTAAAGTVAASQAGASASLTGVAATASAGTIATTITIATVTLTGVSGVAGVGTTAAASADALGGRGRRRRTRSRVRPFPDPAITAPESAAAYDPPAPPPGLPLLAGLRLPGVTYEQALGALVMLEGIKRTAELSRDLALFERAEAERAEVQMLMQELAARRLQDEQDDDAAAVWLLVA